MKRLLLFSFLGVASTLAAADSPVAHFRPVDVDTKVEIGYGVTVADVDGDKKPDIVLADKNLMVWYKNPTWEKHIIAEKLTPLDHVCIAAADINGDGRTEVAAGAAWNPGDTLTSGSVHYLIPPADRSQKWDPVTLPHEPTVHRMRWVKNGAGKYDLVVVPLHGRGNKNGQGDGVRILAYQMPADPRQPWTTELIDDTLHMTHNFHPVQWDADPAEELLVAGKEGVFLFDRGPDKWKRAQLVGNEAGETNFIGAGEIRTGKLPGGKRFLATVEPMHGNQAVTYTPPAPDSKRSYWTRNVLDDTIVDGHAVACGDLSGAGYDQVVVGWRAMNKPGVKVGIRLYVPLDKEGKTWKQTVVDDNTMACEDLCLADLNGDGKLDIVAAGRATKNLKIYLNTGTAASN
jgi:hypothetical protein